MDDKKTIEYLKTLIKEVKGELKTKKLISESKTPQEVFKTHEKNIKEYVAENVFNILKNAEN